MEKNFQRRWTPVFEINDVVEAETFDDDRKRTVLETHHKTSHCLANNDVENTSFYIGRTLIDVVEIGDF